MTQGLSGKLMSVLESTLSKLARYDEGSLIGSILSFTNVSSSGKDLGQGYVNFFRNNMDQVRGKIGDDLWTLNFFEQWYSQQINMLCNWLSERLDHALHYAQVSSISHIIKVIHKHYTKEATFFLLHMYLLLTNSIINLDLYKKILCLMWLKAI